MAPKKKKSPFMQFAVEWRNKQDRGMDIKTAVDIVGNIWKNMSEEEKQEYAVRAKRFVPTPKPILNCLGQSVLEIERQREEKEKEERSTELYIYNMVMNAAKSQSLGDLQITFIHCNYFYRNSADVFIPAEISISHFTLNKGMIMPPFHIHVNPGTIEAGFSSEARAHSETTHSLPLPPNALGEQDLEVIYGSIVRFIKAHSSIDKPIFTEEKNMEEIKSILKYLKSESEYEYDMDLKVYPIRKLFYHMKNLASGNDKISQYMTNACFQRDQFEYELDIGCQFHEGLDKSKYCSKSFVTRWGFMFYDYMAKDLQIPLISGSNCPKRTNLECIDLPTVEEITQDISFLSINDTKNADNDGNDDDDAGGYDDASDNDNAGNDDNGIDAASNASSKSNEYEELNLEQHHFTNPFKAMMYLKELSSRNLNSSMASHKTDREDGDDDEGERSKTNKNSINLSLFNENAEFNGNEEFRLKDEFSKTFEVTNYFQSEKEKSCGDQQLMDLVNPFESLLDCSVESLNSIRRLHLNSSHESSLNESIGLNSSQEIPASMERGVGRLLGVRRVRERFAQESSLNESIELNSNQEIPSMERGVRRLQELRQRLAEESSLNQSIGLNASQERLSLGRGSHRH